MEKVTYTQEQQKVLSTMDVLKTAFLKRDIDGILNCYEPEAVIVFEPGAPVSDKAKIKDKFQQAFMVNPRYEFNGFEIFVNGNIATYTTPWKMIGTMPNGREIVQSGLSVTVLRKQSDGKWLMVLDNPHGQFLMQQAKSCAI